MCSLCVADTDASNMDPGLSAAPTPEEEEEQAVGGPAGVEHAGEQHAESTSWKYKDDKQHKGGGSDRG